MKTGLVKEYYDCCQKYYRWFWYDQESLGMHYGFWDKDTHSQKEALINQYREVLKLLQPKKAELILDAGCGVGGASIWLARKTSAKYVGITLSDHQVKLAWAHAQRQKVAQQAKFEVRDYFKTGFKAKYFDKVFGIESFCYAYPNLLPLFKEMYRILKPGGQIFMSDAFLFSHPKDKQTKQLLKNFYRGWCLKGGNTKEEIMAALKKAGFKKIRFFDKTKLIKKSADMIYIRGWLGWPIMKLLRLLRIISLVELENALSTLLQKKVFSPGLAGYGIFYAEK